MITTRKPLTYPLDTAALIYPAIIKRTTPMLFRLSATLTSRVNISKLKKALENILPRFPLMRTNLKHGLFWNYLEEAFDCPQVYSDQSKGFGYNIIKAHHYPFRVTAFNKRITLEASHLVTDGKGAIEFLKSILAEYLTLQGHKIHNYADIIRPKTPFNPEEIEDMYDTYFGSGQATPLSNRKGRAFIEPDTIMGPPYFNFVRFVLPLDEVLDAARRKKVSLTTFLLAIYTSSYQDRMFLLPPKKRFRRPIRITTPANLRSLIPTKTLRNFIALINLEIDPRLGIFSFDEIINEIHHSMKRDLTAKRFQPFIRRNIGSQKTAVLAWAPLFIKKIILKSIHSRIMHQETSVLSNLGEIKFPPDIEQFIETFDFIPAAKVLNRRDCAVISFKNSLIINFCRVCENDAVERFFFDALCEQGLIAHVEKYSN